MPENNGITPAETTPQIVEMETITLNNREITVPKTAAGILKEAESSLMRGYQEKLAKERKETQAEISGLLEEDMEYYNTHSQELWGSDVYEPKVQGGKGFIGDKSKLTAKKSEVTVVNENVNKPNALFGDDMKVKQLEKEVQETKQRLEQLVESDLKRGELQVIQDRNTLLKLYPYADEKAVTDSLKVFWTINQRHPSKEEIESIIKERHNFVLVKVENAKLAVTQKKSAAPSVSGASPLSKKEKLPRLDDFEAWSNLAKEDMAGG